MIIDSWIIYKFNNILFHKNIMLKLLCPRASTRLFYNNNIETSSRITTYVKDALIEFTLDILNFIFDINIDPSLTINKETIKTILSSLFEMLNVYVKNIETFYLLLSHWVIYFLICHILWHKSSVHDWISKEITFIIYLLYKRLL